MTTLQTLPYLAQQRLWPASGRHILAQADADSVVVYQAYCPEIAEFAVQNQRFGGDFSYSRMSWIKPNFLWMMYRSGWATKAGQESILAIRLRRSFFGELLAAAVSSSFLPDVHESHAAWQAAVASSEVRLQWDPDHDPSGAKQVRKAIQLGLRGEMLRRYGQQEILSIEDVTLFVKEQRPHLKQLTELQTPAETVYQPSSKAIPQGLLPVAFARVDVPAATNTPLDTNQYCEY